MANAPLGSFMAVLLGLAWTALAQAAEEPAAAPPERAWDVTGTFGPWEVRCPKDPAAGRPCSVVLEVMESESRRVLLAWTFARAPDGNTVGVFYTPTGVRIQPGVEVHIDGADPAYRVPFVGCRAEGCTAEGVMTPEVLDLARKGAKARVTLVNLEGKGFNFDIPIGGLAGALDALPKP
jgi:invasion protein IalB